MADVEHSAQTGANLHEPKRAGAAAANTVDVYNGAGSGSAQLLGPASMATSMKNVNINILTYRFENISAGTSQWIVVPFAGDVQKIWSVLHGVITGGGAVFTFKIATVLITNSSLTIANGSSAAGDVDSSVPTGAKTLTAGQPIEIISNGGSTNDVDATFTFEIDVT